MRLRHRPRLRAPIAVLRDPGCSNSTRMAMLSRAGEARASEAQRLCRDKLSSWTKRGTFGYPEWDEETRSSNFPMTGNCCGILVIADLRPSRVKGDRP